MRPTIETIYSMVNYTFKHRTPPPKGAERIEVFDNFSSAIKFLGKRPERKGKTWAEHLHLYQFGNTTFLELVKVKE